MKRLFLFLLCLVLMICAVPFGAMAVSDGVPDVSIAEEKGFDFLFPDIVKKSDGSLVVVSYKNRSDSSHAPYQFGDSLGTIVQLEGSADGMKWDKPRTLVSPEKLAQWGLGVWYSEATDEFYYDAETAKENGAVLSVEARDPNLARLNDGTLLFTFFTRLPGDSLSGGHRYWNEGTAWYTWGRTYIMYSKDEGASWSEPTEIPCAHLDRNCAKRGNIAVYSDDSILIPLYGMSSAVTDSFNRSKWCTANVRARLNSSGEWEFTDEYISNGPADSLSVFGYGTTEASLGTTADDVTYAMIRYYRYNQGDPGGDVFVSADKGISWTKIGSTNPNAMQAGFYRMDDGRFFVTWSQTPSPRKIYGRVFDTEKGWGFTPAKLIYSNTTSADIGDPSGIQLDNGKLFTIFYDTENHHVAGEVRDISYFMHNDGNEEADECRCNCHATGIKKIIFSIINFFQKLFGINRVCVCGAAH